MKVSRSRFKAAVHAGIDNAVARGGLAQPAVNALLRVAEHSPAFNVGTFGTRLDPIEKQCPWTQAGLSVGDLNARRFYEVFDKQFEIGPHEVRPNRFWER